MHNILTLASKDPAQNFDFIMEEMERQKVKEILIRVPGEFRLEDGLNETPFVKMIEGVSVASIGAIISGDLFYYLNRDSADFLAEVIEEGYLFVSRLDNVVRNDFDHIVLHTIFKRFGYEYATFVKGAPNAIFRFNFSSSEKSTTRGIAIMHTLMDNKSIGKADLIKSGYSEAVIMISKFENHLASMEGK